MRARPGLLATAIVLGGCTQENPEFVEPVALYGDCGVDPGACQQDLVCFEIAARDDGLDGTLCTRFECDADEDCPSGGAELTAAHAACRASNVCVLDCTPRPCSNAGGCAACLEGRSCAPQCGPESMWHCLSCPAEMDCIRVGDQGQFSCGHR